MNAAESKSHINKLWNCQIKQLSFYSLVSSFRTTGIFPLKPAIFDTKPESTSPATIYAHDETQPTEHKERMGNAVAQLSTDNEQKKFVTPFLAGHLEESNSYILKFYEIKKQKLE